jgi:transcription antitermination factor NusA-like protein
MPIELSREEKNLLVGLLEKEVYEIRTEIHHTQGYDYKEGLKAREKLVQALLGRLKA